MILLKFLAPNGNETHTTELWETCGEQYHTTGITCRGYKLQLYEISWATGDLWWAISYNWDYMSWVRTTVVWNKLSYGRPVMRNIILLGSHAMGSNYSCMTGCRPASTNYAHCSAHHVWHPCSAPCVLALMQQMVNEFLNFKTISTECLSSKCKNKVTKKHAGLQRIFLSWKDIWPTKSPFWLDKTELWLDAFFLIIILSGSLFEIIISYHYLLIIW